MTGPIPFTKISLLRATQENAAIGTNLVRVGNTTEALTHYVSTFAALKLVR